jgi:hypothetical protein
MKVGVFFYLKYWECHYINLVIITFMSLHSTALLLSSAIAFASPLALAQTNPRQSTATIQLTDKMCAQVRAIITQYPSTPFFQIQRSSDSTSALLEREATLRACGIVDTQRLDISPSSSNKKATPNSSGDNLSSPNNTEPPLKWLNDITKWLDEITRSPSSSLKWSVIVAEGAREKAFRYPHLFQIYPDGSVYRKESTYSSNRKHLSGGEIDAIIAQSEGTSNSLNRWRELPKYSPSSDGYGEPLSTTNSPCVTRIWSHTRIQGAVVIGDQIVACNK